MRRVKMEKDIKALRKKTGLSQSKFAAKVGCSVRTLQGWELGHEIPDLKWVGIVESAKDILRAEEKPPINRYSYEELKKAALSDYATQEDLNRLGAWFERYNVNDWNGEYYNAEGKRLYPIFRRETKEAEFELVGYEFR